MSLFKKNVVSWHLIWMFKLFVSGVLDVFSTFRACEVGEKAAVSKTDKWADTPDGCRPAPEFAI